MSRISYSTQGKSSKPAFRNLMAGLALLAVAGIMGIAMAFAGHAPVSSYAARHTIDQAGDANTATMDAQQAAPQEEVSAAAVAAGSSGAHFMSASASLNSTGALVVAFDESGLGNGDVNYVVNADATATYACINGGGKNPRATNKQTFSEAVSGGATFQAKNGRVRASITIDPISAGGFSCPSGQSLVLADVSYTNVSVTDTTNDVMQAISGTFSKVFFNVR